MRWLASTTQEWLTTSSFTDGSSGGGQRAPPDSRRRDDRPPAGAQTLGHRLQPVLVNGDEVALAAEAVGNLLQAVGVLPVEVDPVAAAGQPAPDLRATGADLDEHDRPLGADEAGGAAQDPGVEAL